MISTEMAEKMVADKMSAESKPAQQETEQTKADTTVTPESTEDNHPKVDNPEEGAKGTPEEVAQNPASYTGFYLKKMLENTH